MEKQKAEVERLKGTGMTQREISNRVGVSEKTVWRWINNRRSGAKNPARPASTSTPTVATTGMTRDNVRIRHDSMARMTVALDRFVASMQTEKSYEESELARACRVGKDEAEYWERLTSSDAYLEYQGYTERGVRIWALPSEQKWLEANLTGYRRRV